MCDRVARLGIAELRVFGWKETHHQLTEVEGKWA
jgi:hypothetical protein